MSALNIYPPIKIYIRCSVKVATSCSLVCIVREGMRHESIRSTSYDLPYDKHCFVGHIHMISMSYEPDLQYLVSLQTFIAETSDTKEKLTPLLPDAYGITSSEPSSPRSYDQSRTPAVTPTRIIQRTTADSSTVFRRTRLISGEEMESNVFFCGTGDNLSRSPWVNGGMEDVVWGALGISRAERCRLCEVMETYSVDWSSFEPKDTESC